MSTELERPGFVFYWSKYTKLIDKEFFIVGKMQKNSIIYHFFKCPRKVDLFPFPLFSLRNKFITGLELFLYQQKYIDIMFYDF